MITIEEVIDFFEQDFYGDNWDFKDPKEAAAVVRAQHEDLEKLRSEIKHWEKACFEQHEETERLLSELERAEITFFSNREEIERLRAELSDVRADQSECNAGNEWQAGEIVRLRADLANEKNWHKALKPCPQALLDAVDEAYERAAQVCETAPDLLQNSTFAGAAAAIRSLKAGEPK